MDRVEEIVYILKEAAIRYPTLAKHVPTFGGLFGLVSKGEAAESKLISAGVPAAEAASRVEAALARESSRKIDAMLPGRGIAGKVTDAAESMSSIPTILDKAVGKIDKQISGVRRDMADEIRKTRNVLGLTIALAGPAAAATYALSVPYARRAHRELKEIEKSTGLPISGDVEAPRETEAFIEGFKSALQETPRE